MTDADKRTIKKLWDSRVPINQIIQMLPYKKAIVKQMIDELRSNGTLQPRSCKKIAIKAVGDMFDSGVQNIDELCEAFGYSYNTIKDYLSLSRGNNGRPPKNYRKRKPNNKAQTIMVEIAQKELSLSEIARKYGVSRQYVYQLKQRVEENNNG